MKACPFRLPPACSRLTPALGSTDCLFFKGQKEYLQKFVMKQTVCLIAATAAFQNWQK